VLCWQWRIPDNDDMSTVDTNADELYLNAIRSLHFSSVIFVLTYFLVLVLVLVFEIFFSFSFVLVFIIFSF